MRKQTKVLAAAALFTLGASFSAFAAKTGKWVLEDEGWMCYDKYGDPYTNEWCLSAGKEFYVGDDGVMVTSDWVEYDNNHYYVGSNGAKTISDWRYTTPLDDEDADEEWFYFDSKGKRVDHAKKVIGGKTYYFDNDGIMLTGWVDTKGFEVEDTAVVKNETVYCDENGARLEKQWIEVYHPDVDVEEDDLDNESMHWYWLNSDGQPATGKKANIKGQTYYFDMEGRMLSGWVAATDSNSDGKLDLYFEIDGESEARSISDSAFGAVFFCGDSDDGHAKKNTWLKTWKNTDYYEQDTDDEQEWFWIGKDGVVFVPSSSNAVPAHRVKFEEGELVNYTGTPMNYVPKTINKKTYAFNEDGEMISGFVRETRTNDVIYFGGSNDGTKKTGTMTINDNAGDSYKFCFGTETKNGYTKYAGVNGNKSGKLYKDGLLVTPSTYKYREETFTVNGKTCTFLVNASGTIQTSNRVYEDGDFRRDLSSVKFNKTGVLDTQKNSY